MAIRVSYEIEFFSFLVEGEGWLVESAVIVTKFEQEIVQIVVLIMVANKWDCPAELLYIQRQLFSNCL